MFDFPHVRIAGLYFLVKQKYQRSIIGLVRAWNWERERTLGGVSSFVLSLSQFQVLGLVGSTMLLLEKFMIERRATRFDPWGPITYP